MATVASRHRPSCGSPFPRRARSARLQGRSNPELSRHDNRRHRPRRRSCRLRAEEPPQGRDPAARASRCSISARTTAPPSTIPTWPAALAAALGDGRASRGVLVCGTGVGISIAANRHRHVRAALCHDVTTATLARQHNDANVLVLGARVVGRQRRDRQPRGVPGHGVRGWAAPAAGRQAGVTRPSRISGRLL